MKTKIKILTQMLLYFCVLSVGVTLCLNIFFEWRGTDPGSLIPLEIHREKDPAKKWALISKELERSRPKVREVMGRRYLERVKELVYVAQHYAPDEGEGSDRILLNSCYVKYFRKLYPGMQKHISPFLNDMRVSGIHKVILNEPPSKLSIVVALIFPVDEAAYK